MKKRMIYTLLSLLFVLSMFPAESTAAADSPSSWAVTDVTRAGSLGLIPDNLNGNYTRNITRAEFCALAVQVYEKSTKTAITQLRDFTDTTDINVRKIGGINVVSGTGNGKFNPNGDITRQEAAVILANLMSALSTPLPASEPSFADNAQIDSWAWAAVGQVQKAGIMAGTGNGNFTPKSEGGRYTREQSIVTLMRVWDMTASETQSEDNHETAGARILVAYFSCTGNTKALAEYAADILNADLYEIKPEVPYTSADLNYNDSSSRSIREQNDSASRPAISGTVESMSGYDVVFLGYPIWSGQAPRIISSFLENYDFSDKVIVPFCTSGGSGIGSSASNLHKLCADSAVWLSGSRLNHRASREDVEKWIDSLDIDIKTDETSTEPESDANSNVMPNISITVDGIAFSLKIYDNEAARALLSRIPMTLTMSELNGNEKYYYLPDSLPANSQRVGNINAGDLMLYGSDCLVLFYKSFSSSYSYTKLGYIEDVSGLADALGRGSVEVRLSISR